MKPDELKLKKIELKLFYLLIIFLLFFGTAVSSANAKVMDWEVKPENPEKGDMLIINGLASPEEEVEVSVSFGKTVPVYLKEYTYEFENIEIINFNNLFTIRAEGVENLKVKMKTILSKTESTWANEGIATISYSGVSPGAYKARVEGIAEDGASGVNLKVTTVQKLKAGKDGKFSYIYRTGSVPSGKLEVRVGDSEREIIFDSKEKAPALQGASASSEAQISGEPEDRDDSELILLTGEGSRARESMDRESEEKRSIYLTESSWDENNTITATAGEVPSKEPVKEQENQEDENQATNFLYLLAGVLAGSGYLLLVRRKK
ncbi:hypothetical protein RSJ42_15355 [Methanosarcina hadiensis]|uniref:hypothetical protein n=1 Tax=Methanosarcina hadiensis TaxID=3078083 RepID=UPI003977B002